MKPLPKLDDEAAMLLRGKRSALASARNEAAETLRDACTRMQGCEWAAVPDFARDASAAINRLLTLAAMAEEL